MSGHNHSFRELASGFVRLFRAFRPEIARQRKLLAGAAAAVLLTTVFQILEPWPLKFIYDQLFGAFGRRHGSPAWFLSGWSPERIIGSAVVAMILMATLAALTNYLNSVLLAVAASRVLADVRLRLFSHIANLSISFHNRSRTGDLTARVIFDIDRVREVLVTSIVPFISYSLTLAAMLGVMFWMNWRLALIAVVAFPVFFLVVTRLTRKIRESTRVQRQRDGVMAATTSEVVGSIRVVHALSLQDFFSRSFSVSNVRSLRSGVETVRLSASLERTAELLAAASGAMVLWAGAHAVLNKAITPGELIVFLNYLRSAFKPLRQLAKYLGQMAKAVASGDRVLDLLHTEADVKDCPGAVEAPPFHGHIRFEDVRFAYEDGKIVLDNVSFELHPGERAAIVGESGSGKSTLAGLLLRFHDPQGGRILIDGAPIDSFTIESLRRQISIVMQESVLFAATVRENIALGAPPADMAAIEQAARIANAHEFISRMPNRYDTQLGERGATVSGGQRQRIAIARAAIRNAPIMLLDEPSTGLDEAGAREVEKGLRGLWPGRTTILITHNLDAAREADVILYMAYGRIAERGTHDELMERNGKYAQAYRRRRRYSDALRERMVMLDA
jgi:ATP-binding cassette subfamily B protein